MHRFDLDNVKFVRDMQAKGAFASISLGVKKPDYDTVDQLAAEGLVPEYVTIDIAHGHADSVKNMIAHLKEKLPASFVIAGNVGTPEADHRPGELGRRRHQGRHRPGQGLHHAHEDRLRHRRLAAVGAQVVRPRGDQADHCRRRHPRARRHRQEHPLRRHHGDDRLACWPATRSRPARRWKSTAGCSRSTTAARRDFNKGEYKHVEGKRILEPVKGKLADTLREMEEDVQSSISYAGGKQLMDIRKVNYVILGGDNAGEHLLM